MASRAAFFTSTFLLFTFIILTIGSPTPSTIKTSTTTTKKSILRIPGPTEFPKTTNGIEIPFKLVSITPQRSQSLYFVVIFIKMPKDLIQNEDFVDLVTIHIEENFENSIDAATKGEKVVHAELKWRQKKYDEIVQALYLIDFVRGDYTSEDFLTLYKTSFLDYVDEYYELIEKFRRQEIHEVTTNENSAYTVVNGDVDNDEVRKINEIN